jgi:hypothetical protein
MAVETRVGIVLDAPLAGVDFGLQHGKAVAMKQSERKIERQ